jgi:hypothetical protein
MTEKLHAKHSPSSLKNKETCPHWENRPGSSKAADEGSLMHEAADTGHLGGLNDEQLAQVQLCIDFVTNLDVLIFLRSKRSRWFSSSRAATWSRSTPLSGAKITLG